MVGFRLFGVGLLALLLGAGCQSSLVNAATQAAWGRLPTLAMTEQQEAQLGAEAYQEILNSSAPSPHAAWQEVVERVGRRIASAAGRDDYDWEFRVLAGDVQNAFCLPGGKVAVYEGLLPLCQNEAGLAVVMSHEVAHALARHGGERMREQAVVEAVGDVINAASEDQTERRRMWVRQVYGAASQVGVLLPFSRKHELEADSIGLMLMANAGYDPDEAPRFWSRFSEAKSGGVSELFSTHPADERRIAELENLLPQAQQLYAAAADKLGTGAGIPNLPVSRSASSRPLASGAVSGPRASGSLSAAPGDSLHQQRLIAPATTFSARADAVPPPASPLLPAVQPARFDTSASAGPSSSAVVPAAASIGPSTTVPHAFARTSNTGESPPQSPLPIFELPRSPGGNSAAADQGSASDDRSRDSTMGVGDSVTSPDWASHRD